MICQKCKEDKQWTSWERGKVYTGIDAHHNPPEFMFDKDEKWQGEMINLCRKHHQDLHIEIRKILNEEAGTLKFINSDYYVLMRMSKVQKIKARERIFEFTKKFIEEDEKGDATDIAKA